MDTETEFNTYPAHAGHPAPHHVASRISITSHDDGGGGTAMLWRKKRLHETLFIRQPEWVSQERVFVHIHESQPEYLALINDTYERVRNIMIRYVQIHICTDVLKKHLAAFTERASSEDGWRIQFSLYLLRSNWLFTLWIPQGRSTRLRNTKYYGCMHITRLHSRYLRCTDKLERNLSCHLSISFKIYKYFIQFCGNSVITNQMSNIDPGSSSSCRYIWSHVFYVQLHLPADHRSLPP